MIVIDHLSKSYGTKKVLEDINLTFNRGEVHGIIGNNGAGKSTLFKCIAGIEKHGGNISSDCKPLKNHLGFLHTEPYFFSRITGREYIRLLCNGRQITERNFEEKNIFDLPLNEYAVNYSTGMQKKLAITGILLQGNDYFIFDEPFNGLDIQSNIIVTALIHQLKTLNKVIIISSHIFSTLNDTCDKIHLLKNASIHQSLDKEEFGAMEQEMKALTIGNRIERLQLK
jgi:ABC-2 type transport system ATP-binding protein